MLCSLARSSLTYSKVNCFSFPLQGGDHQLQAESADSFLNLLLLADSSLDETSAALEQQESMLTSLEDAKDALAPMANSNVADGCSHQLPAVQQEPEAPREHHTVAGMHCTLCGVLLSKEASCRLSLSACIEQLGLTRQPTCTMLQLHARITLWAQQVMCKSCTRSEH